MMYANEFCWCYLNVMVITCYLEFGKNEIHRPPSWSEVKYQLDRLLSSFPDKSACNFWMLLVTLPLSSSKLNFNSTCSALYYKSSEKNNASKKIAGLLRTFFLYFNFNQSVHDSYTSILCFSRYIIYLFI